MKSATFAMALLGIGLTSACLADDMMAAEQAAGSKLGFLLKPTLTNATLSIAGPNGFHASTFSKSGAVAIDLTESGPIDDGVYTYQVTASGRQTVPVRTPLNNGRAREPKEQSVGLSMSGTFHVKGGKIVKPKPAADAGKTGRDAQ